MGASWTRGCPFMCLYYRALRQCCRAVSSFQAQDVSRHHRIIFSKGWIELNPARSQNLCHQREAWVKSQLALRLLLLTILQLCHLPPPLPPPDSNSSCPSTRCQPMCQLLYCTIVLFKVLYCKIQNVLLIVIVYFLCIFCVKSIINLLQYSTI